MIGTIHRAFVAAAFVLLAGGLWMAAAAEEGSHDRSHDQGTRDLAASIAEGIQLWQDGSDEPFNKFIRNEVLPYIDETEVRDVVAFKLTALFTLDELEMLKSLHDTPGGEEIFNKIGRFNSEMGPIVERMFVAAIKCVPPSRRPYQLRDAGEHDDLTREERCRK